MSLSEHYDFLILGTGQGGKQLAWPGPGAGLPSWSAVITHLTIAEGLGPLLSNVPPKAQQ